VACVALFVPFHRQPDSAFNQQLIVRLCVSKYTFGKKAAQGLSEDFSDDDVAVQLAAEVRRSLQVLWNTYSNITDNRAVGNFTREIPNRCD
jgi:hypothetical protein